MGFLDDNFDRLEPKYQKNFQTWKTNPTPANTGNLLRTVQGDIDKGIFAHVGKAADPILHSRARRMALQAIKTYDPTKAKLSTHIINQLQGLKRVSRQQSNIVAIPERVTMDQGYIERAKAELEDEYGREPTMVEIADRTGISPKRINYVRKFRPALSQSFFDDMSDENNDFAPAVDSQSSNSWFEFVYSDMDPTNQKIMEWTLGLHGARPLSNQEIARKLRMTPGAVSQRKAKIQKILNQEELNPFAS